MHRLVHCATLHCARLSVTYAILSILVCAIAIMPGFRKSGHIYVGKIWHVCVYFIASQMWNLVAYLPLMIGDKIQEDDCEWELFLLLLDILQICVSAVLSIDMVDYLRTLIKLYLASFRTCYPGYNIIPKQHYLIHLPSQILKYERYLVVSDIFPLLCYRLGPLTTVNGGKKQLL